jgi:hypothetical protein
MHTLKKIRFFLCLLVPFYIPKNQKMIGVDNLAQLGRGGLEIAFSKVIALDQKKEET